MVYPFAYITSKVLGIKYELRGAEILAKEQAAVLVVNHQSVFDVLGNLWSLSEQTEGVTYTGKHLHFWRLVMLMCDSTFDFFLQTADQQSKLLIFPEGTRNLNAKTLSQFKKGGFRVAIIGKFPVIPVVYSLFYFIDPVKKRFSRRTIIKALEPISTDGLKMDDIDSLIEKTWKIMSEYEKLRNEICNENK
ncbi:putative 1-acyl-sn-glycerol-3-phosphate acyltransferase acl-1 [Lycorma delicatula]|uniref:putative 1-acyl-sn-glycerol-3-phosphate acyltransferase acl-1 n=1 Tax=Lycorma delicatula TaxID=130591 RepID=UPI003F5115F3